MTLAGSIFLIMIGAILTWAVEFDLAGVDINVVGVILMVGGLFMLVFGIWRMRTVPRTVIRAVPDDHDPHHVSPVTQVDHTPTRVYEERRYDDPLI